MEDRFKSNDPYIILSVERNSSEKDIKKAYVRLIKVYRPDKYPEEFKVIQNAYEKIISWSDDGYYEQEKIVANVYVDKSEYSVEEKIPLQEIVDDDLDKLKKLFDNEELGAAKAEQKRLERKEPQCVDNTMCGVIAPAPEPVA